MEDTGCCDHNKHQWLGETHAFYTDIHPTTVPIRSGKLGSVVAVMLVAAWEFDEYLYQVWEVEHEYLCLCIDQTTLETLWEAVAETPGEAMAAGIRESLKGLS